MIDIIIHVCHTYSGIQSMISYIEWLLVSASTVSHFLPFHSHDTLVVRNVDLRIFKTVNKPYVKHLYNFTRIGSLCVLVIV